MFRIPRTLLPAVLAVLGLVGVAEPASAGWLTIKNETRKVILIQETGGPQNRPLRGRCIKLQPGETFREYHRQAGEKSVILLDSDDTDKTLRDRLRWPTDGAAYAVKPDGRLFKLVAVAGKR